MRRIRIVTALAALSIMTVASAATKAETNTAPGNPIPLLKKFSQSRTKRGPRSTADEWAGGWARRTWPRKPGRCCIGRPKQGPRCRRLPTMTPCPQMSRRLLPPRRRRHPRQHRLLPRRRHLPSRCRANSWSADARCKLRQRIMSTRSTKRPTRSVLPRARRYRRRGTVMALRRSRPPRLRRLPLRRRNRDGARSAAPPGSCRSWPR